MDLNILITLQTFNASNPGLLEDVLMKLQDMRSNSKETITKRDLELLLETVHTNNKKKRGRRRVNDVVEEEVSISAQRGERKTAFPAIATNRRACRCSFGGARSVLAQAQLNVCQV